MVGVIIQKINTNPSSNGWNLVTLYQHPQTKIHVSHNKYATQGAAWYDYRDPTGWGCKKYHSSLKFLF